jgi:RIO kinase 1
VHRGRLVLIDLPQMVDLVANPQGHAFLARDIEIVTDWFTGHGLPAQIANAGLSRLQITRGWQPVP